MTETEARKIMMQEIDNGNIGEVHLIDIDEGMFIFKCYYKKPIMNFRGQIRKEFEAVVDEDGEVVIAPN